jgi:hypothetical protein
MPTKQDLFGGSRSGVSWDPAYRTNGELTKAFEEYLNGEDGLSKAIARHEEGRDYFPGSGKIAKGVRPPKGFEDTRRANLDALEQLTKSVGSEQLAQMSAQIETMRESLVKDWDAGFPETGSLLGLTTFTAQLAPVDLEGPAKLLVPRETPILNAMPRENDGIGSAVQYRRILGWSNSGVGGVPDLMPFMNSEYPSAQSVNNLPVFGGYSNTTGGVTSNGLGLRRGARITYTADAHQVAYTELSLSDVVSTKAYYIGQGYQDVRQLSATALLWAHKGGEERAMLHSRGTTANGYTGPISAPGNPTVTVAAGGAIAAGTYQVVITAVGSGGESVTNPVQQPVTTATTNLAVQVVFPALPSGATGWNIYMTAIGVSGGPYFFQVFVPGGFAQWTLTANATTGGFLPTIATVGDTTANPNGYDGMLTTFLNPAVSGYVGTYVSNPLASFATSGNSIGGVSTLGGTAITTPIGDKPWQTAFATLYGASTEVGNYAMSQGGLPATVWPWSGAGTAYGQKLLARPQTVYVDGAIRSAMGQFVRTAAGGSTAYRITMPTAEATGGMEVGAVVNGIANQVTGDMVDFDVHPYMPVGASIIWTKTLPFPDSEITNTVVAKNVQDYLYQMWPQIQFTYDASTYQLGSLIFYAPAWSGALVGLIP